jgi:hypothetical protein
LRTNTLTITAPNMRHSLSGAGWTEKPPAESPGSWGAWGFEPWVYYRREFKSPWKANDFQMNCRYYN